MSEIRELFDQDIYRRIEKVIQYQTTNHELLKQEVEEYVATDTVQSHVEAILDKLDDAMSSATDKDVGVWVSGFYGSGKSSFTKYLGFALDSSFKLGDQLFRDIYKQRLTNQPLQQRLSTVASKHNPVVILVDLSVDYIADDPSMPISNVLFHHVLKWAGYSSEEKLAFLEMHAEEKGRLDELKAEAKKVGEDWNSIHNNPAIGSLIGARIAVRMFPELFSTEQSFMELKLSERINGTEQVERMLALIKKKSGRDKVIFIVDEAGQYASHSDTLVLNLQGFAQNLQVVGKGKAWIFATAQQTLTDDVGALNSPKLFKLKDRFAIPIELKANDIKVITHTRLLSKKPGSKELLAKLFAEHGPRLNVLTRLENARGYTSTVELKQFVDLYPFLPQHFDLMMNIIARLAKSTGGTGLRSAIKVVQETLIAGKMGDALAEKPLGTLVTVVRFYDILRGDLENSPQIRHTVESVNKTISLHGEKSRETEVAKVVAVMQILDDFPLNRKNLAALLVSKINAEDESKAIGTAIDTLLKDSMIPLEEVDGRLRFLSDQAADLASAWRTFQPTSAEQRQVLADAIKDSLLAQPPSATILGKKTVKAGVVLEFGGYPFTLHEAGDGISVSLRLVDRASFKQERQEALNRSTAPAAEKLIVSLSATDPALLGELRDAFASSRMIRDLRGKTLDADEKEFATSLNDRLKNARARIEDSLRLAFEDGAVVFRGQDRAVKTTAPNFPAALSAALEHVALQVYDKFEHAAVTVPVQSAEKILKTKDHGSITSLEDPLNLLAGSAGGAFNNAHPAVIDIQDFINQRGSVDGKTLLDDFSKAPYGWNKDVSRYVVAAMFVGSLISLRIDSKAVTAASPVVVEAFKSNVSFARVGIDAPPAPPPPDVILRAKNLLVELTGHVVTPLPQKIEEEARATIEAMIGIASQVSAVGNQLGLGVRHSSESLASELRNFAAADQNAVIKAFGDINKVLGTRLAALKSQHRLLTSDYHETIRKGKDLLDCYRRLPATGSLKVVKEEKQADLESLASFFDDPDLEGRQVQVQTLVANLDQAFTAAIEAEWKVTAARQIEDAQKLRHSPIWADLPAESKEEAGQMLDHLEAKLSSGAPKSDQPAESRLTVLLNSRIESDSLLQSTKNYMDKQAEENRRKTPGKVVYIRIPARDLELREARATLAEIGKVIESAPEECLLRFKPEV